MFIILSQRIDFLSDYEDTPFSVYHYPKVYKNQIKNGDYFIYYQGDRKKKKNRYYYGCGIVGDILESEDGESYYATVVKGIEFPNKVSIYNPSGGFYEFADKKDLNINPAWQRSIRKISEKSFDNILSIAGFDSFMIKEILSLNYQIENNKKELKNLRDIIN